MHTFTKKIAWTPPYPHDIGIDLDYNRARVIRQLIEDYNFGKPGASLLLQTPSELAWAILFLQNYKVKYKNYLEIDAANGAAIRVLSDMLQIDQFYVLDNSPPHEVEARKNITATVRDRYHEWTGNPISPEATNFLRETHVAFDLVLIEAHDHHTLNVTIEMIRPFLEDGAVVLFHNTKAEHGVEHTFGDMTNTNGNKYPGFHAIRNFVSLTEEPALGIGVAIFRTDGSTRMAVERPAVFWHIALMNHWQEVVKEQLNALDKSGLAEHAFCVYGSVLGTQVDFEALQEMIAASPLANRIRILYHSTNLLEYEWPTLNLLHQYCFGKETKVLYIHTKGVSHEGHKKECTTAWRQYLQAFVIDNWRTCVEFLDHHDLVSTNWVHDHFSGNFWWGNSVYITHMGPIWRQPRDNRIEAEWWACKPWAWNPKPFHSFFSYNDGMYLYSHISRREEWAAALPNQR